MSTSSEQGPRLRRLAYEPAAVRSTACTHCGSTTDPTAAVTGAAGGSGEGRAVPVVTVPDVEAVRTVAAGVVRVLMEVLDGRRGAPQLARVASPPVCRYVRAARLARGAAEVTRVRSLRLCRPVEDVVEAAVVVLVAGRVRAVATRVEREAAGWRCTAFRVL